MYKSSIRTHITKLIATVVLAAAGAVVAFAHGGFEHVMGTVSKVTPTSVTVKTTGKKTVEVVVNDKTAYTRGDAKIAATELKAGDRVVIDATEVNDKLVAASVKVGAAGNSAATHK